MEKNTKIEPHKITKPIQLLAAWLTGLVLVNGAFLIAAAKIQTPTWVVGVLVISCVVNVPLFLISIFLLQTKFRPEMQEDSFYSKYLDKKSGQTDRQVAPEYIESLRNDLSKIEEVLNEKVLNDTSGQIFQINNWNNVTVSVNKSLPYFTKLVECLQKGNIPIHELFGGGGHIDPPKEFKIAIGANFSVEQIKSIAKAASTLMDGWLSFAHDEDEPNEYDNRVLIGAWGSYEHGIQLSAFNALAERNNITEAEIYKVLGIEEV